MKAVATVELRHKDTVKVTLFERSEHGWEEKQTQESALEDVTPLEGVNDYVLILNDEAVHMRYLELPFTEEDKLREVVPYELMELTTYPPEDIVFSALPVQAKGLVLVGYTERQPLEDLLNTLQRQGIEVQRVTALEFYQELARAEGRSIAREDRQDLIKEELLDGRIDFLRGTIGYERRLLQFRALFNATLRLAIVLALALASVLALKWYPLKVRAGQLSEIKKEIFTKIKPGAKAVAPVYQLKAEIRHMKETLQSLSSVEVLEDLTRLSEVWPEALKAEEIEIKPEGILIKGYAEGLSQIETLKAHLEKGFPEVSVIESEKAGQLMRYTIEVKR